MISLHVADHAHDWKKNGVALVQIDTARAKELGVQFSDELSGATHAIVHFDDTQLNELKTGASLGELVADQIILCVTTYPELHPGYDRNTRPHTARTDLKSQKTRFLLYARNVAELQKREVFEAFCRCRIEDAWAITREDFERIPKDLRFLFGIVLYVADHDRDWKKHGVANVPIDTARAEEFGVQFTNELSRTTHAIIHFNDTRLNELETGAGLDELVADQIILCVTTNPRQYPGYDRDARPHAARTGQMSQKTRFLLYARDVAELQKSAVFKAFCHCRVVDAKAIKREDFEQIPRDLRLLFRVEAVEALATLAVLIQGYLPAYVSAREKEGLGRLASDTDLEKALTQMGWSLTGQDEGHRLIPGNLWRKFGSMGATWWQKPFLDERANTEGRFRGHEVSAAVEREWVGLRGPPDSWTEDQKRDWERILHLVEAIVSHPGLDDVWILPDVAAQAYLALAPALGKR